MVMGGGCGRVEVVSSKGCSRLFLGPSPSGMHSNSLEPMSPAASSSSAASESLSVRSNAPFSGLVICVTGLSKEARKQVMEATERLGGRYSPDLHPQCTHLVVQSFCGHKFEHALKHGRRNGLFVVTLGWFVDSVRKNVRLSETLYNVKNYGENDIHMNELERLTAHTGAENSCLPAITYATNQTEMNDERLKFSTREFRINMGLTFSGCSIYIDSDIPADLRNKVTEAAVKEGATLVDQWFIGCRASHVVCEGISCQKYFGHSSTLVTPLWILKTIKEKCVQRLAHISTDLARQISAMLEDIQNGSAGEGITKQNIREDLQNFGSKLSYKERRQIVNSAKNGVRNRRGRRMQTCQTPIRPITPNNLLDSICWSISEPASTASIYTDSSSVENDAKGDGMESEASFANSTRPLTESEISELILKNHILTILFPIDRFAEMGPSSRTFFSNSGFQCQQVLDHIYAFYQENLSAHEIEAAIHTDSRHADRLRSLYSSKEAAEHGYTNFRRIDFLGSRRSFEMLKRVNGDHNSNVYELILRA